MSAQPPQAAVVPRKKPTQSRSKATVDAVLAASARILEEHGMAGFNTNAVAVRAGVSIGSLYQYFPSKDAILLALMEQSMSRFHGELSDAIDHAPGESLAADLMFMLQTGLTSHTRRPSLMRLLEGEFQRLEGHMNKASQGTVQRALERLLERYLDRIRPGDPAIMAHDVGAIAKVLMSAAGQRSEADWDAVIERTARAMVGYLGADWDAPALKVTAKTAAARMPALT